MSLRVIVNPERLVSKKPQSITKMQDYLKRYHQTILEETTVARNIRLSSKSHNTCVNGIILPLALIDSMCITKPQQIVEPDKASRDANIESLSANLELYIILLEQLFSISSYTEPHKPCLSNCCGYHHQASSIEPHLCSFRA